MSIRAPRGGAVDCVDGHMSPVECVGQLLESFVGLYAMPAHDFRSCVISCVGAVADVSGMDVRRYLVGRLTGSLRVGVGCRLDSHGCVVGYPLSVSVVCSFRSCALWVSYNGWWVCAGRVFSVLCRL